MQGTWWNKDVHIKFLSLNLVENSDTVGRIIQKQTLEKHSGREGVNLICVKRTMDLTGSKRHLIGDFCDAETLGSFRTELLQDSTD